MKRIAWLLVLLASPASAQLVNGGGAGGSGGPGMLPTAANRVLPDALNNLGLGTANTPSFLGLLLNGLTVGSGTAGDSSNSVLGLAAGNSFTSGAGNTAMGSFALGADTSGSHNTAVGWQALKLNQTGQDNLAIGFNAFSASVTGDENVAVGDAALATANGASGNTAVGQGSMQNTTSGANNAALGWGSLYLNMTGAYNTAIGYSALYANTTGNNSVAVGNGALIAATTGANSNTAVGQASLGGVTTGTKNTGIGYSAGSALTTQTNTVILGGYTGSGAASTTAYISDGAGGVTGTFTTATATLPGNLVLSSGAAYVSSTGTSIASNYAMYMDSANTVVNAPTGGTVGFRINNTSVATITSGALAIVGTTSIAAASDATHTDATVCRDTTTGILLAGSGAAGICLGTSSLRFKRDVGALAYGLDEVMKLEPIHYRYTPVSGHESERELFGFAAEQVNEVMPKLVGLDNEGRPNSVDWAGLVPVLVKAMQEQQAEIAALKAR